jgi:hypothetical protein
MFRHRLQSETRATTRASEVAPMTLSHKNCSAALVLTAALGAGACMKANGGGLSLTAGGLRGEVLAELGRLEKRALKLLDAMPHEKLGWKPAEDSRTASAIFVHIGNAPHFISAMLGVGEKPTPAAMKSAMDAEKSMTDKTAIKEHLEKAFAKQRRAIESVSDSQLDDPVKAPFGVVTKRFFIGIFPRHLISHISQLGIYARMVGVTPPWVPEERKRFEEMMKKQMGGAAPKGAQ